MKRRASMPASKEEAEALGLSAGKGSYSSLLLGSSLGGGEKIGLGFKFCCTDCPGFHSGTTRFSWSTKRPHQKGLDHRPPEGPFSQPQPVVFEVPADVARYIRIVAVACAVHAPVHEHQNTSIRTQYDHSSSRTKTRSA